MLLRPCECRGCELRMSEEDVAEEARDTAARMEGWATTAIRASDTSVLTDEQSTGEARAEQTGRSGHPDRHKFHVHAVLTDEQSTGEANLERQGDTPREKSGNASLASNKSHEFQRRHFGGSSLAAYQDDGFCDAQAAAMPNGPRSGDKAEDSGDGEGSNMGVDPAGPGAAAGPASFDFLRP